jgi:hypothetical protein
MGCYVILKAKQKVDRHSFDIKGLSAKYPKIISDATTVNFLADVEMASWRDAEYLLHWLTGTYSSDGYRTCFEDDLYIETMRILKDACDTVLKNREQAKELMPTRQHKYDEAYFNGIRRISEALDICLSTDGWDFYFCVYC